MGFLVRKRGFLAPLLLALLLVQRFSAVVSALNYTSYRQVSSMRLERIQRHLDKINKPPVMTIESPDGDIIDCVHKRKQPALDHPLLRNHKIQRDPPERPRVKMLKEDDKTKKSTNVEEGVIRGSWQMWHRNGTRCPKGTVPIRRSTAQDVLRSKSLFDFGKKQAPISLARRKDAPDVVSANGHEHAIAYTGSSQEVYGAKATINVWDPSIQVVNEFSLSQIWVLSGSFDGSDLNSIEATMSKDNKERAWEQVQIKAFTSWLNSTLEKRKLSIDDIKSDLSDGVRLINFLEILSNKKVTTKYDEKPPSRIQKIQNLHIALKFLEKEMDVKLHGIGAEDFADQNLKLILGFLWTLFKQYKINVIKHEDKSSEEGLLAWCKQTTAGYKDVNITDFKNSFRDGKGFLALVDKFLENKELFDFDSVTTDNKLENLNSAFDAAEKQLGVPKLLEAQEVAEGTVDDRSLVLYISLYFHAFVAKQQQKLIELEKRQIEERVRGLEGSLEQRAARGAELEEENLKLLKEIESLRSEFETQKRENNELRDKNAFLEERVNVLQQLLETANQEKETNQSNNSSLTSELNKTKEELSEEKEKRSKLEEVKLTMEEQVGLLQGQVDSLSTKFETETKLRKQENEDTSSRNRAEVDGLGVLKRNLEQHIEDLFRWQKFLDAENDASVDFTGELRPQIIADISKSNFNDQLKNISAKLEKENEDLEKLLKQKEAEQKVKKAQEEKKRERQKKNEN